MKRKNLIMLFFLMLGINVNAQLNDGSYTFENDVLKADVFIIGNGESASLTIYNYKTKKETFCELVLRQEHGVAWYEGDEECEYLVDLSNEKTISLEKGDKSYTLKRVYPDISDVEGVYKNSDGDMVIISSYYENQFNFHVILKTGNCSGFDYHNKASKKGDFSFISEDGDVFKIDGDKLFFEPGESVDVNCNISLNSEFIKVKN